MEELILFIIITGFIALSIMSILVACGILRCLFFRPTLSPIRDQGTIPGLYTLDVPLQQDVRRQSIFETLNEIHSDNQRIVVPAIVIG